MRRLAFLIPVGERVAVHLNLGQKIRVHGLKTWSVHWKKTGRVLGHVTSIVLEDVKLRVGQSGADKAEGGEKTVHAFADGVLVCSSPSGPVSDSREGIQLRYNPHPPDRMKRFMRQDGDGNWTIPVVRCHRLTMTPDWLLFATGVVDLVR